MSEQVLLALEEQLAAGASALGLALSPVDQQRLLTYLALLDKWNRVYNLTAVRETERMVSHHLLDSLAIVPYVQSGRVLDVGSGGGLPGIPLAIARPELEVTLIDSVAKKTAFLLQAKAELGLENVAVVTGRVEAHQDAEGFGTITSRAFSDLKEFVTLTRHLLAPGGHWLAMKGLYPHEEIAALPDWVRVSANPVLSIPHLDATRHLIILEPGP
ncbi:MAG: 16S rRNA (guanine(527)-N(7))-methyltransferase RsmG [Thiobacillus sp.]